MLEAGFSHSASRSSKLAESISNGRKCRMLLWEVVSVFQTDSRTSGLAVCTWHWPAALSETGDTLTRA